MGTTMIGGYFLFETHNAKLKGKFYQVMQGSTLLLADWLPI